MARLLGVVNSESERLGEAPTIITYTPEWPFGRYTHPAGGRFIRGYGQTSPLPETLTELQRAETESPPARAYLDEAWVPKPPELSPHEWGATTRPMSAEEKEYLAAWGRPRLVTGRIAVPTITSVSSVVRVADPDWCETWGEWCTWDIAGLRPGRPARFGIKMSNIAEDYIGGGPFLDVGSFKVEINGTVVGEKVLSKLATTYIDIPANLINPDGTTWVRVYGTPHNFYIHNIGASVDQPGVVEEVGWIERNKGPVIVAGLAGVIVLCAVA